MRKSFGIGLAVCCVIGAGISTVEAVKIVDAAESLENIRYGFGGTKGLEDAVKKLKEIEIPAFKRKRAHKSIRRRIPFASDLTGEYGMTEGTKAGYLSLRAVRIGEGAVLMGAMETTASGGKSTQVDEAKFWVKPSTANPWRWEGETTRATGLAVDGIGRLVDLQGSTNYPFPIAITFDANGKVTIEFPGRRRPELEWTGWRQEAEVTTR